MLKSDQTFYYVERQEAGDYVRFVFDFPFATAYNKLLHYDWKPINPSPNMLSVIMENFIEGKKYTIHIRSDTTTSVITYLTVEKKFEKDIVGFFDLKPKTW